MKRADIIAEYKKAIKKRQPILDELINLRAHVTELEQQSEELRLWMDALEKKFDREYGCYSDRMHIIRCHLSRYISKDMEVPE